MSAENSTRLRGVVYARKSKTDKDGPDGSIEQQLGWSGPACEREKIDVAATFTDDGKSGHATSARTAFHQMLAFCQEQQRLGRPVDVIVTWHSNRFSRADSQETGWFLWEFRKAGVRLMLTSQRWIDFEKMEDRVLLGIEQDVSSHKYSKDLAEASTRGKISRAAAGRWCGGRVPYGYKLTFKPGDNDRPVPDKLVPDPETADVVRWLFKTYAAGGYSLGMLAAELNAKGEPTPSMRLKEKRQATSWNVPAIRNILRAPTGEVYLGRLIWNKTTQGRFLGVVKLAIEPRPSRGKRKTTRNDDADMIRSDDTHEPLTDPETFALCQRRLVENRRHNTPKRGGAPDLVLTGLLWCGHCGKRMVGKHKNRGTKRTGPPLFLCGTYHARGKKLGCYHNSIRQEPLLEAILRKLRERFTPEFLAMVRRCLESHVKPQENTELAVLTARLADLEQQVTRATRRMIAEEDDALAAQLRQEARRLIAERDRASAAVEAAQRAQKPTEDPTALVDTAMQILARFEKVAKKAEPQSLRAALLDMIERVELWFSHEEVGRETRCSFARGLIWLREDSPLAQCLAVSSLEISPT